MAIFPVNDIIKLLDHHVTHQLGESTSRDLTLGELLDDDASTPESLATLPLGYGPSRGDDDLRALVGAHVGVAPEHILITPGGAAGLFLTTFTLCGAGDEVVVLTPNFPPTLDVIEAVGATRVDLRLDFERGYRVDERAFRAALSERTKLVILVTPGNPSGVAIPPETLRALDHIVAAESPQARLLVDETYRAASYGDEPMPPSAATLSPRISSLASLSKAHGAPGLRIGWLVCRDPEFMDALIRAKMNVFISCSVVDERLAAAVLRNADVILGERRAHLATGLDRVGRWVEDHADAVQWVRPDGGALCCVRLRPEVFDDDAVARFYAALPEHDAMVARGPWFGDSERVFRVGFGYLPLDRLDAALAAVSAALAAAAG
ncbi:pyridoxal phosphate-dependent aminotransferase [Haliangium sp.]|uniref:pyridoxal phosphate-dependent aminotransferase n=1 Tax=Haliangium sp. TaxID=2663208 RepID=UPI003D0EEB4E